MILVDTSVWVDHLRHGDDELIVLLNDGQVVTHPFVIGELALGYLKPREAVLRALQDLPCTNIAAEEEVLRLIDRHALFGTGISYIDAHLLAAASLTLGVMIWTRDKHLSDISDKLGLTAPILRKRNA